MSLRERREQVDDVAVGILDLRIPLLPECVPRRTAAGNPCIHKLSVETVDVVRRVATEGHRHSMPTRGGRPVRIEGSDRLLGVEGETKPTPKRRFDMTMAFGVGIVRELQPESSIKLGRPFQVRHDHADDVQLRHA